MSVSPYVTTTTNTGSAALTFTAERSLALPIQPSIERRTVSFDDVECRDDSGSLVFEGHAAVFDKWSEDLGGFREKIDHGAFRKVLRNKSLDVTFLWNHSPDSPLARSTVKDGPGSLVMKEDAEGLAVKATFAPTTLARDLAELVRAKVVTKMSFAWPYGHARDTLEENGKGVLERTIHEFTQLRDVSLVTFPAYRDTDAAMRAVACGTTILEDGEVLEPELRALAASIHRGDTFATKDDRLAVDEAFAQMGSLSPWMEELARRALGLAAARPADQGTEDNDAAEATVGSRLVPVAARERRLSLRTRELTGVTR